MSLLEIRNVATSALDPGSRVFAEQSASLMDTARLDASGMVLEAKRARTVTRTVPEASNFAERVFNALVALKVAVSQYAMHISDTERRRIFDELDSVINAEDWHPEDRLPEIEAFKDFLRWMIYSKYSKWISIGVSDDGDLLVAWKTRRVLLTASFSGQGGPEAVRWTARMTSPKGETGYAVGRCPIRLFAEQALFYLKGAEQGDARQHS